jgi:microcystin-dependent protein
MQPTINALLDPVVNFGKATVSAGYTNLDTVIVLTSGYGSKFPTPSIDGQFNLVWHNSSKYADSADDPNVEIVRCTTRTGDVLTIVRGQEGTSASSKNSSGDTYNMMLSQTKKTISDIKADYQSIITSHAAITTNVHNFDASGNAPAQTHNNTRHSATYLTSTDNITARSLKSATTTIDISGATAPSSGQVLTATGSTAATWQVPTTGAIPTGGIIAYAGATAPTGFLMCDGAAISRAAYSSLFSAIGTTYGIGDNTTTFNVPDYRSRDIIGAGPAQGGLSARTLGSVGGEEIHTLTIAEMPSHTHTFGRDTGISGSYSPDVTAGFTPMNGLITSYATGGGSAHNNMQPFGVANYIIKT